MVKRNLLVTIPEYHEYARNARTVLPPQNFQDLMDRIERPGGYWCVKSIDKRTGEVLTEVWAKNAITDNGALSLWKNMFNASAGGIAVANILAISQTVGYTTLNGTIASGASPTSITVGALTGPTIPSGSTLLIGAGTTNTCTVTTSSAITGAGTYTVTTVIAASGAIASGANIQVVPPTTDASSIASPVSYTAALPSGQFSFSGTGSGNRQVQVTNSGSYLFSTTANSNPSTATAASYTDCWLVNTNPVSATTQTFIHVAFPAPVAVNSSSNGLVTIVEKI
jgi:hypothetical protein